MMTTPTLESYTGIQSAYDYFNRVLFDSKLPSCLITYQRQKRIMGYVSFRRWVNEQQEYVDELAINPEYFANYPTIEICQTLCHEMVHIWQAHHGQPGRRGYHNKQWCDMMTKIGLMPSSTGKPGGDKVGEKVGDYIMDNGPFMKACRSLLEDGFSLSWIDRFPVYREDSPVVVYEMSGKAKILDSVWSKSISLSQTADKKKRNSVIADPSASADDVSAELLPADTFEGRNPSSTKPTNRSNRNKYRCSSCGIQVWGKPGLSVKCGECDLQLVDMM